MAWASEGAEGLLAGPSGRRLCVEVLDEISPERKWASVHTRPDPANIAEELAARIADTDLQAVVGRTDPSTLLAPLAMTVDAAAYWQPLDVLDVALGGDGPAQILLPVAEAISRAPAAQWWDTPVALDAQYRIQFDPPPGSVPATVTPRPTMADSAAALQAGREDTLDDEHRAADRPTDLAAPFGGRWWSTPGYPGLSSSTRSLPGAGPVGLFLVEDRMGWTSATVERLKTRPKVRVYEVDGPAAWTELVARYPLGVTNSRRHDWWKITGRAGDWLLPDYQAVAIDYDAIHVSVLGYLASAARALDVGTAGCLLAGWDPDATWWLTDGVTAGPATHWITSQSDTPLGWHQAS